MFMINTINEDSFKIIERFSKDSYVIDYYGDKLLVTIGDIWKVFKIPKGESVA